MSERVVLDVNAVAIFLVENHPGNPYISSEVEAGLGGNKNLLVMDYLPFRAHHVLTDRWGVEEGAASRAVRSFLESRIEIVSANHATIKEAFDMADRRNHEVYDCFYLALAKQENATHLLTTDRDFERLCREEEVDYLNPVPEEVLDEFSRV